MKNSSKWTILLAAAAACGVLVAHWHSLADMEEALVTAASERLVHMRQNKAALLEADFKLLGNLTAEFSVDPTVIAAMNDFKKAFPSVDISKRQRELYAQGLRRHYKKTFFTGLRMTAAATSETLIPTEDAALTRQFRYIVENPHPVGAKDKLDRAPNQTEFSDKHALYHPALRAMRDRFSLHDLHLIDMDGRVVYSVAKEIDFAANLREGPLKESGLAKAFEAAVAKPQAGDVYQGDFSFFLPTSSHWAAFTSAPIFNDQKMVGVLVSEILIERIDAFLLEEGKWRRAGMGMTGEVNVIGADQLLRNDTRAFLENPDIFFQQITKAGVKEERISEMRSLHRTILLLASATDGVKRALAGREGVESMLDYRGVPVVSAYAPLHIPGLSWVISAQMDQEEIFAPIAHLRQKLLITGLVVAGFFGFLAWFLKRRQSLTLAALVAGAENLSQGERPEPMTRRLGDDSELRQLGQLMEGLADSLQENMISRKALNDLLDRLSEPVILFEAVGDPPQDGIIRDINRAGRDLLQCAPGEFIGHSIRMLFVDNEGFSRAIWSGILLQGGRITLNRSLVARSGEEIPVQITAGSLPRNAHQPVGAMMVCQNLSERLRLRDSVRSLKERLDQREAELEGVHHHPAISVVIMDLEGHYTRFNEAWCRMTGYAAEALATHTDADLTHPDDLKRARTNQYRLTGGEIPHYRMEKRFVTKGGKVVWGDLMAWPVHDMTGQCQEVVAVIRDVTENKRLESLLREERSKLAGLLDNLREPVYIVSEDYRIEYMNPAFVHAFAPKEGKYCHTRVEGLHEPCKACARKDVFSGSVVSRIWERNDAARFEVICVPIEKADCGLSMMGIFYPLPKQKTPFFGR